MSGISDKELKAFLDEANSQEIEQPKKKELLIAGMTQAESTRRASEARRQKAIERKQREKEIIQESINSTFIDLNAPLEVKHKKMLIKLLTEVYTTNMQNNEKYIINRVTEMLKLIIPYTLLNAYKKHKGSIVPAEGFMYKASQEYGQGLQFKITLDLPYYFHPDDIQHILQENWPERLISIDKSIVSFYKNKETRTLREVKLAEQLAKVSTFYALVKKNPFWYDTLVQHLKSLADESNSTT